MLSVAVGSNARTVNVQSSWFCWNRLRRLSEMHVSTYPVHTSYDRLHLLFLCNSITTHALPRIRQLAQDILRSNIAGSQDSQPNRDWSAVALEPASCSRNHGSRMKPKVRGLLHRRRFKLDNDSRVMVGGEAYVDEQLSSNRWLPAG